MNCGMNHAPGAGSIARPVDQQSSALLYCTTIVPFTQQVIECNRKPTNSITVPVIRFSPKLATFNIRAGVAQWYRAGLQIKCGNQSCTWGMIRTKIHLISPGFPRPSSAIQCRIVALNSIHLFHYSFFIHPMFIARHVRLANKS